MTAVGDHRNRHDVTSSRCSAQPDTTSSNPVVRPGKMDVRQCSSPQRDDDDGRIRDVIDKVNLAEKLAQFTELFSPRIVGELNGQHVKLVKVVGDFIWHHHEHEDELFLVLDGHLDMHFRDRIVGLGVGEFVIVPRGVEHKPSSPSGAHVLLFEPAETLNTGNVRNERTVDTLAKI
jgi:mannose-6-phosphate isomerase-like protein (cupin superfamily)